MARKPNWPEEKFYAGQIFTKGLLPRCYGRGTQADRIIRKMGGAARLQELLQRVGFSMSRVGILKWRHPFDNRGTGGIIPPRPTLAILDAAALEGIFLTPEDWDPRERKEE